jgi:tRNA uridine 5-carboxymethylaminomethyl modification enzyme
MKDFDIIVVGGGHAGIEAASASSRMGLSVALITMIREKIGLMSCNPAIGGLAKGQLVKEIDALGGEMARIIDATGIHFKMLNTSRGPAVWSPRAQADRQQYAKESLRRLLLLKKLTIIESSVNGLLIEKSRIRGVRLNNGQKIFSKAVILTAGTFLNGLIHIGLKTFPAGRAGEPPAIGVTEDLIKHGIESGRLKTGTPPRLLKTTIDFNRFIVQEPDEDPTPFSFLTDKIRRKQVHCHIGHTNLKTHQLLKEGFSQSPLFTGKIKSIGPRYCPSIETKIDRFPERNRHQLFLEPEGYDNPEVYLNGFATSLSEETQLKAIKTIPGLENASITRLGYAIEYDFFPPHQLKYSLETKSIKGLFMAGQLNGTSGYEEAAAQGIIAGINAALFVFKKEPFQLARSEAYIGVLIDDLINKSTLEPYRMFTSRAEFRLLLRQDNADIRLAKFGRRYGLLSDREYKLVEDKIKEINELNSYIRTIKISPDDFRKYYLMKSSLLIAPQKISILLKRPEINLEDLLRINNNNNKYSKYVIQDVEFNVKYDGYIKRNLSVINRFKQLEEKKIPANFNYQKIESLSTEAKEKLDKIRPASFGQASRISGVSPADVSVLLIYLEKKKRKGNVSRETVNAIK